MKTSLEELSLSTIDITGITSEFITNYIIKKSQEQLVYAQLFREIDIPQSAKFIVVPRESGSVAVTYDISPSASVPESDCVYDGETCQTKKYAMALNIDNEALNTKRNILQDFLDSASRELSYRQDLRAETILLNLQTGTLNINGSVGTASVSPLIEIKSVSSGTIASVDYFSGTVNLTGSINSTITFTYTSNRTYAEVSSPQTLTTRDIFNLETTMRNNTVSPDVVLVNGNDYTNLIFDASSNNLFISKKEYDNQNNFNSEIGMIGNLALIESNIIPAGCAVVADSSKIGFNCIKRRLKGKKKNVPSFDQTRFYCYAENDYCVSNSLSIGILVNGKSGLYRGIS